MTTTTAGTPRPASFDALAEHGRSASAAVCGVSPSGHMTRALVRAHGNAGVLYCGRDNDLSVRTVRALVRRGLAEAVHERGRTDARRVIVGMHLTIRGTRQAQQAIREGDHS